MSGPVTLTHLLDDAALLSFEHQLHLADVLGEHQWQVDLDTQVFQFDGERPLRCTRFHLLGSAAPGPQSWLWAWANPAGYAQPLTGLSAYVRDFGRQHGIAELADGEVPFDTVPGSPGEPNLVAAILADAAKAVSGSWTSYTGDAGGGTRVAFLVEHPDFQLPQRPTAERVMRILRQSITELPLTDHRRALHSYAVRRSFGVGFNQDSSVLSISAPDLDVTITFDELGRVGNLSATMRPST